MIAGPDRIVFLDCPVDALDSDAILDRAQAAVSGQGPRFRLEGLNVAKLVDARREAVLMEALREAEIVHIDGGGIALGLSIMGRRVPRRAGVALFVDLCGLAARLNAGVYLLGARPDVVVAASERLRATFPALTIAGCRDGYFGEAEEAGVIEAIRRSGAAMLFIGISSPKKELFLQRNWEALGGVKMAMGVGGSFDIVSGRLPRAPLWMQRCYLEWLFRMALEPRRLAGRYLRTNVVYAWLLARARLQASMRKPRRR